MPDEPGARVIPGGGALPALPSMFVHSSARNDPAHPSTPSPRGHAGGNPFWVKQRRGGGGGTRESRGPEALITLGPERVAAVSRSDGVGLPRCKRNLAPVPARYLARTVEHSP